MERTRTCTFYETTGNPKCPFHIVRYSDYGYYATKRPKSKRKTARRVYGKSR